MRGQRLGTVGIRTGLCSSRFSQHGSTLSHLDNNLLHLHMMNTTMNRQQGQTVHTDMNSMMISLQHHNLILGSNFKSEAACYGQGRSSSISGPSSPLSIEFLQLRTFCACQFPNCKSSEPSMLGSKLTC